MIISIGKIKGIYHSCRKEFLRAGGSDDAAHREAVRFLDANLRMFSKIAGDEWWFAVMLRHIKGGRMWRQLGKPERQEVIDAVRAWEPFKPVEVLPITVGPADSPEELMAQYDSKMRDRIFGGDKP